jgi:hypothetical protein
MVVFQSGCSLRPDGRGPYRSRQEHTAVAAAADCPRMNSIAPDVPRLMQVINTRESADPPHRLASVACSDNVGPEYLLPPSSFAPDEFSENVSRQVEVLNHSRRRREWQLAMYKWSRDAKLNL